MKRTLLLTITLSMASLGTFAQNVNIPDANFKAYLIGNSFINTNSDTEIQISEATAFTGTINCTNLNISDLTGVEAFTSLTQLVVSQNALQSLDVTQNTDLIGIVCHSNNISSLDLSQNTALTVLNCSSNSLTSLDVSFCPGLTYLNCWTNNISSLDVSFCSGLTNFYCADNSSLTSLNMKNLSTNTLTSFDATSNPNLTCIEVDNVSNATSNWTNIDPTASFSLNCNPLEVDEVELIQKISIYPNPVESQIYINADVIIESVNIIDALGEIIISKQNPHTTIDVSNLSNGVYLLQVSTAKGIANKKFIKN